MVDSHRQVLIRAERVNAAHAFFASCPRGLEPILNTELEGFGAKELEPAHGGLGFIGDFSLCYRANLGSRIASRVLWRVHHGPYRDEEEIYQAAYGLPWTEWFSPRETIKVKVSAQHCTLKSLEFVTLRIKDAVCDKFKLLTTVRPSVDTQQPDIRIDAFIQENYLTLYLDTSGEALFKRGLRKSSSDAPIRENLAAGILKLSGWAPDQPLLDPMCGSGTILMEAAQMARNISPGLGRRFAFEKFKNFDRKLWSHLCDTSRSLQRPEGSFLIDGCDRQGTALRAAETNLRAAGLADAVRLQQADVLELSPPAAEGVLVTNPPYGVRTGDAAELAAFYPRLGDALKRRFAGWRAYILTADLRLPKLIGLAPSRRIPLFNGALECRLFEFKIVAGSNRQKA
ncbi:MAG TPA: THUMP domain-containing protein [Nitrospirales bacterium]